MKLTFDADKVYGGRFSPPGDRGRASSPAMWGPSQLRHVQPRCCRRRRSVPSRRRPGRGSSRHRDAVGSRPDAGCFDVDGQTKGSRVDTQITSVVVGASAVYVAISAGAALPRSKRARNVVVGRLRDSSGYDARPSNRDSTSRRNERLATRRSRLSRKAVARRS